MKLRLPWRRKKPNPEVIAITGVGQTFELNDVRLVVSQIEWRTYSGVEVTLIEERRYHVQ